MSDLSAVYLCESEECGYSETYRFFIGGNVFSKGKTIRYISSKGHESQFELDKMMISPLPETITCFKCGSPARIDRSRE